MNDFLFLIALLLKFVFFCLVIGLFIVHGCYSIAYLYSKKKLKVSLWWNFSLLHRQWLDVDTKWPICWLVVYHIRSPRAKKNLNLTLTFLSRNIFFYFLKSVNIDYESHEFIHHRTNDRLVFDGLLDLTKKL